MPKRILEMTVKEVQALRTPGNHYVGGVAGLFLQVTAPTVRSWILRASVEVDGRVVRREYGLGGFPAVSLADARVRARALRTEVAAGRDPINAKKEARKARIAEVQAQVTFATAADLLIARKQGEWKSAVHYNQWVTTLATYAYPVIGNMPVSQIETSHIVSILEPIWSTTTETATRLRSRIEAVLDSAIVAGLRSHPNPARWKGHLDKILPKPSKVAVRGNHPALPFQRVSEFVVDLRVRAGMGARALEFLIQTGTRTQEVLLAKWSEIDIDNGMWVIPAERMKVDREHRVPLVPPMIELLEGLGTKDFEWVFPGPRGDHMTNMVLISLCRRMSAEAGSQGRNAYIDPRQNNRVITPHGFRSSFRDWASELTDYQNEIAEMALAHSIKNAVEASYRRGDVLEKRRRMMLDWAAYCYPHS